MKKILDFLTIPRLCALYLCAFGMVALQKFLGGAYNNYLMYVEPYGCLVQQKTMYVLYPELYYDLYKYSPVFAFLMAPFHYLPKGLGVVLWNVLNTGVLLGGILYFFKNEAEKIKKIALLIVFLEALTSAQNLQSNNLLLGLILFGISFLRERKSIWLAALMFSVCAYFKFYGMAGAIFFVFYPQKISFLVAMTITMIFIGLLPVLIVPFDFLMSEYLRWFEAGFTYKVGTAVNIMGVIQSWFSITQVNYTLYEGVGLVGFLLPFWRKSHWQNAVFQQSMIASFLVFIVIFNPAAESPTYIYALMGVAFWYLFAETNRSWQLWGLLLVIIFTSLSSSDIFPRIIRNEFLLPFHIKAVPCIMVWLRLQWLLWQPK